MWAWIQEAMGTGYDGQLLALLADGGLKGMVLMAVAGLAVLTMRRSTASARHLVYFLALVGLLVLPLGSLFIPKWQLPLLPAVEGPPVDLATPPPASDPSLSDTEVRGPASLPVTAPPMPAPTLSQATPMFSDDTVGTLSGTETPPRPPEARHPGLAYGLLALWLTVAFALLFPLVAGMIVLRRMARQSSDFSSEALPKLTQDLAQSLGLRHPVRLLRAPADTMPMAAGLFRAVVFLPADAENWSDEKRGAVLLHELAHVKRRDCLTHALAHLAVSLHWFNPLAWLALRQLRIEREHACDDLVLAAGQHPTEYAEVLLDVARSLRAGTLTSAAAITMAKKSHLEGRLLAVLDEARKRTQLTRRNVVGFVLVGTVLTAALATLHITRAKSTVVVDRLTFSSGVEVTLLGVGISRDDDARPWKPDGTPLEALPEGLSEPDSSVAAANGQVYRQLYQRTTTPENLPESVALRSDDYSTRFLPAGISSVMSGGIKVDEKETRFDIEVGVAAGLWEPLAKTQLENGTQGIRDGVTYDILVGKPFKRDDDYLFTLTHNVTELDKRVVVYDTAGEMHYSPATGTAPGINGTNQGEYSLGEVVPEEVRFVELQVREFEWLRFRNIAVNPEATPPPSDDAEEAPAPQYPSTPEESQYTATFSPDLQAHIAGVGQPDGYTVSSVWAPDGTPLSGVPEGYATKMGGSSSDKSGVKRRFFIEVSPVPEENDLGIKFKVEGNSVAHNVRKSRDKAFISAEIYNLPDAQDKTSFELGIAFGPWESLYGTLGPHSSSDGSESGAAFSDFFEKEGTTHVVVTHTPREDDFRLVVFDRNDTAYASRIVSSFGVGGMHQTEFVVEGDIPSSELVYMDFQARPFEWRTFSNIAIHPDDSDATGSVDNPTAATPPVETVPSRPVDKIPYSPGYETASASDTEGRVQIGGGDFGVSKIRRMDGPNALKALEFPMFPDDMLHAARFPELAEGDWDCLLINVADNGSHGNKLMKYFDVVQFRVFDHSTRKLLWDSDWRYNENPKFTSGSLTGQDIPVFVARRDQKWPDTIDLWFRVDLLNNGKNTHQMLSVEPNYSIAGGDTGRVQIDEIRAGTWNHSYSESGGDEVTWIEQSTGSEASECSVVLRRTGNWTDGRVNVRALDATGNEYWPQSTHFLDFERAPLQVVTFPLAADRVHQLKFARLENQEDFRKTFFFDGINLPPVPAPPATNIKETEPFPPPTLTLSAHEFQLTGTPVTLRLDNGAEKFDSFTSKITIRCDGEELPWFSTEESGVKMKVGANFSVSPRHPLEGLAAGKHRVSVLLHDVELRPRSGADREAAAVYPILETNEVEFEVLPEIPADYFEPTMEDGWKSMLDNSIADPRVLDHDGNPVVLFLDWHIDEGFERPFALAFDIAMEEQTSGSTYPMGRLSDELRTSFFQPRQHIPLTMDNDDARDLFRNWYGKQVRLVMTPSSDAALEDPAIRSYYGEAYRTDWIVLKPELTWSLERSLTPYGVDGVVRYGNRETHFGVEGVHRYGDTEQTILIEDWGLTCKAIVDGGAVVLDAESETRILSLKDIVLPGAALDYVQQHLKELNESEVRVIAVEPGALNYIGVRAPSGEAWILLLDTNRFGEREIYRWQVPLPESPDTNTMSTAQAIAAQIGDESEATERGVLLFDRDRDGKVQQILDAVASERIEDSIRMLRKEAFSPLFWLFTETHKPAEQVRSQEYMLHQPRVAKIMGAALEGDETMRKLIMATSLAELTVYVGERQRALEGEGTASVLNGGEAFPTILAEVDRTGDSLPTLLHWYSLARTEAEITTTNMISMGMMDHTTTSSRMTYMEHIASAAYKILERLSILDKSNAPFPIVSDEATPFRPQERIARGNVSKMEGYELGPKLHTSEADGVMEQLRGYLEALPTTPPELLEALLLNDRRLSETVETRNKLRPIAWGEVVNGLQAALRLEVDPIVWTRDRVS